MVQRLRWILNALLDTPRLHITSHKDGTYTVETVDDILLYTFEDARHLSESDARYMNNGTYWRCFLSAHNKTQISEIRRHITANSSIGLSVLSGNDMVKTGLEYVSGGYGTCRYKLQWQEQLYYFESTTRAPNSSLGDQGSLRCATVQGSVLAWLTRTGQRDEVTHPTTQTCATIWFEPEGVSAQLIEMIISGLLAITNTQFQIVPADSTTAVRTI